MEAYVYVVCIVGDYVFLSHGLAVSAFFAGRKFSSSIFPFTEMPKVFSRLFVLPLFPIGRLFLRSGENIRKEELHFVYSSGNIETVSFYSVSQGLEKRAVCRSPDFGLCAQLFASDVSQLPLCRAGLEARLIDFHRMYRNTGFLH